MPGGESGPGGSGDTERDEDGCDEGINEERAMKGEKGNDRPLSLEWPDTLCKQAVYLFLLPIIVPLWLTLPDVRKQVNPDAFLKPAWRQKILNVCFCCCFTEIQKILCGHLPGLHSVDLGLLLPLGVVGPSGQSAVTCKGGICSAMPFALHSRLCIQDQNRFHKEFNESCIKFFSTALNSGLAL